MPPALLFIGGDFAIGFLHNLTMVCFLYTGFMCLLQVTLTVVLMDKSKSRTVTGRARMGDSVWKFGEEVGMPTLTTSSRSQGGYVFRRQGGESYRERLYPHLTLADVGVREGDTVEFTGDFDDFDPKA